MSLGEFDPDDTY